MGWINNQFRRIRAASVYFTIIRRSWIQHVAAQRRLWVVKFDPEHKGLQLKLQEITVGPGGKYSSYKKITIGADDYDMFAGTRSTGREVSQMLLAQTQTAGAEPDWVVVVGGRDRWGLFYVVTHERRSNENHRRLSWEEEFNSHPRDESKYSIMQVSSDELVTSKMQHNPQHPHAGDSLLLFPSALAFACSFMILRYTLSTPIKDLPLSFDYNDLLAEVVENGDFASGMLGGKVFPGKARIYWKDVCETPDYIRGIRGMLLKRKEDGSSQQCAPPIKRTKRSGVLDKERDRIDTLEEIVQESRAKLEDAERGDVTASEED